MWKRYRLYIIVAAVGVAGALWLTYRTLYTGFWVVQPKEGLAPGTRFLQVRWKQSLQEEPDAGAIPFTISPELPILSVRWVGPKEAILHLGEGLMPSQTYELIGKKAPFRGKDKFFTQPLKVVLTEGGYVWGKDAAYQHAMYFRMNASLPETTLQAKFGDQVAFQLIPLSRNEFLAVSQAQAQAPYEAEFAVLHAQRALYEGDIRVPAYTGYELRSAEVAYEEGRFFVRLRGNRPAHANPTQLLSYLSVEGDVPIGEVQTRGVDVRLYLTGVPSRSFSVMLRPGFPDGIQGLPEADTLELAPPPLSSLIWAQEDIHYVAQGQGLRFIAGPSVQTLRVSLWRIRPENERLFFSRVLEWWDASRNMEFYGERLLEGELPIEVFPKVKVQGGLITRALGKDLEPGTYYVTLRGEQAPWQTIGTWFVVSDWYLLARQSKAGVWVAAIGRERGEPLSDVRLLLMAPNGQIHSEATTRSDGTAFLEASPFLNVYGVLAQREKQTLFLLLERFRPPNWSYATGGFSPHKKPYHLYLTGARTLYRPGDTLVVHGYLRTKDWYYASERPTLYLNLRDPRANTLVRDSLALDKEGHFRFSYILPAEAITGTYDLVVSTKRPSAATTHRSRRQEWEDEEPQQENLDEEWRYPMQVEFFRPDRLVIEAEAQTGAPKPFLTVSGRYLYGAAAALQKGEITLTAASAAPETPLAANYSWSVRLPEKWREEFLPPTEYRTDANGQAQIPLPLVKGAGLLELKARLLLYDEENRPNYLLRSIQLPTQPLLIGIRQGPRWVMAGQPLTLELRALAGPAYTQLAKGSHTLTAEVWEVQYEYAFYEGYYGQYRQDYQPKKRRFLRTKVELTNGEGTLTFTPKGGAYEVLLWAPGQDYPTVYEIDAWGWGTSSLRGSTEGQVLIEPQDSAVEAGRKVSLLIKAPLPGKALLTIEREKVCHHEWIDLPEGTATLTLKTRAEYAPGVYAHVVVFHAIGDKATPFSTSRGLVYLPVARPRGLAQLTLKAPEQAKPGTPLTLSLQAPAHPKAHILLTATDEGVWQKQLRKPQKPEQAFYQKWAHTLGISEHLPYVASWGKEVIGGGPSAMDELAYTPGDGKSLLTAEAYEATYAFDRVLRLDEKGAAQVTVTLPAFSGRVRWRAYLLEESAYGSAEAFTMVAAPVVGRMGVSFYMAEGEAIETQLTLRNTTSQAQSGQWKITVAGEGLEVLPSEGAFSLGPGASQLIKLRYKATRSWGLPTLTLYVNNEEAQKRQIRLRPAEAPRIQTIRLQVAPGQDTMFSLPPDLFYNPKGEATLILSTMPVDEIGASLLSLLQFPHGCAEQITSQAFVSLKLGDWVAAFSDAAADSVKKHVEYVVGRLPLYRAGGGYTFWPYGSSYYESEDAWLTLYIHHFLIEAKEAGYESAEALLKAAASLLSDYLRREAPERFVAAYSAFLLARLRGSKMANLLPSVKAVEEGRDPIVRAFWRAAFKLAKASVLPNPLPPRLQPDREGFAWYYMPDEAAYWYAESYAQKPAELGAALPRLTQALQSPYLSTHETVWLLLAYQRLQGGGPPLSGTLALGQETFSLSGTMWRRRLREKEAAGMTLRLKAGADTLRLFVWGETYPRTPQPALAQGLSLTEELIPKGGRQYTWRIRLRKTTRQTLENLALTVPFPSGFMLDRAALDEADRYPASQGLQWTYTDPREDRFLGYFNMESNEAQIELPVRLLYQGRYRIPSISALVMYSPAIQGTTASRPWESKPF